MGTGTDVAMESAGVTLVKGDLRGIVRARRLSRATMRNIRQNLFFAFVYNALGVPIAAGRVVSVVRYAAESDDRERGDDVQFGVGDWKCLTAAAFVDIAGFLVTEVRLHGSAQQMSDDDCDKQGADGEPEQIEERCLTARDRDGS